MKKPIKDSVQKFLDTHEFVRKGTFLTATLNEADTTPEEDSPEQAPETLIKGSFEPEFIWQWRISLHRGKHPNVNFLEDVDVGAGTPIRFVPRGTHQPELSPGRQGPSSRGKPGKKST